MELNKEATPELVQGMKPDVVIVATGSIPIVPDIPGVDKKNVVMAIDMLLGKSEVGDSVIVRGGGLVASDIALYLAQKGKKVTMVTGMAQIAPDLRVADIICLRELLDERNVKIWTETKTLEITGSGLLIEDKDGNRVTVEGDTVVIAVGFNPNSQLVEALKEKMPNVYAIGDCVEPRLVVNAVWEAARLARDI